MVEPREGWESERLRRVLDQLTDAVVAVDRDFRLVYANRVALAIVGKRLEEVVGVDHWDLLPELRDTVVWDEYHRAMETGIATRFEYRSPLSGRWLEARAFPSEEGMTFHLSDVTDRKRAEEERLRRETTVRSLIDAMPQIAWAAEPDGRATTFNARWYAYTGLSKDDPYVIADIVHPEDAERVLKARTEAYSAGGTYETQVRLRRHDGAYRWHLTRAEPMRDESGKTITYVGTSTDIHEERLATDELRRAEHSLSLMADAVPLLVAFVDRDLRYVFANRTFETWYARPRAEVIGRKVEEIVRPEDMPALRPLLERARWGERLSFDRWVQYPDGVERYVYVEYVPRRSEDGEVDGFYTISNDLTERALRAEALERSVAERTAELRASNQALQGFTYHVAHDLRAPLRAIGSTSHIILEDYAEGIDPDARTLLHRQAEASDRLGRLIDDLLRHAHLSQGEITRQDVDLTDLAQAKAEEALRTWEGATARIEVRPGLRAKADADLVGLVLSNLLENAVKYSPSGGRVCVGQREDGAFFVSDEGIGIEPKYFDRIFEPFQRLHRDDEFSGTGIGLSNVRQIVLRHGGRVWVESEKGKGSTFLFTLE